MFGRDVVGQVADDVDGLASFCERAKVGLENVGFDDLDVGVFAEAEGQFGGERVVELDGNETLRAGSQNFGDGAVAGTDFDDGAITQVAERIGRCDGGRYRL